MQSLFGSLKRTSDGGNLSADLKRYTLRWIEASYEARDASGNLIGRIRDPLEDEAAPEEASSGGFLKSVLGAFLAVILPPSVVREGKRSTLVLEGPGREPKGEIRRRLLGWRYRVYDAKKQLIATVVPRGQIGDANWGIDDAKGQHLANYDRSDFDRQCHRLLSDSGAWWRCDRQGAPRAGFRRVLSCYRHLVPGLGSFPSLLLRRSDGQRQQMVGSEKRIRLDPTSSTRTIQGSDSAGLTLRWGYDGLAERALRDFFGVGVGI